MTFSKKEGKKEFNRKDPFERAMWAESLIEAGKINEDEKRMLLEQLLNDKYAKARVAAAEAISYFCDKQFRNVLEQVLIEEPEFEVRLLVLDCLRKIKSKGSKDSLLEALMVERHALVRKAILDVLDDLGAFDEDTSFLEAFIKKEHDVLVAERLIKIFEKTKKLPSKRVLRRMAQLYNFYDESPQWLVDKLFEIAEKAE